MAWLRIDDGFAEHEKIENLTHAAFRLHVASLCLCARLLTDGRVNETQVKKVAVGCRIVSHRRYVDELVNAKLWAERASGWQIKDYLDYNPSSEQVKEQRKRAASRQAKYRESNAESNAVTHTVSDAAPYPNPYPFIKDLPGNSDGKHTPGAFSRLMEAVGPVDEDAMAKLRGYESRLPEGVLAKVAESVRHARPRNRIAYALGALRRELQEAK